MNPRLPVATMVGLLASLSFYEARANVGDESVGMNVHNGEPAFIDACAALGVRWVRMDGNWFDLEPADGTYNWAAMDAAIDHARTAGLSVYISLGYTPAWVARHGDTDGQSGNDVPNDASAWTTFVSAAVTHFVAHGVLHYGMWNEANLQQFWEGTASEYANLIAVPGAAAVRAACPSCLVVGPELANVGPADDYLESVMRAVPSGTFDIVSHHNYGGFQETGWHIWSGDSFINALDQQRFPFTRRSIRQVLDLVGWTGEVWITETGYRATPNDANAENLQAIYVRRVLEEQLARAWYTNTFFYEIHDCGPDQPGCPIDGFGVMRATSGAPGTRTFPADFRQKPAFTAIHDFIQAHPSILGTAPPPQCGDGVDNDRDGRIDGADRGCTGPGDDDESNDPPRASLDARQGTPRVDGALDEWAPSELVLLDASTWKGTEELGTNDLEVRAGARWSTSGLWLAFDVTDDVHDNPHGPAELWQGDSVQLALDVGSQGGSGYDTTDDHEINFALAGAPLASTSYRYTGPAGASNDFEGVVVRRGTSTTYEVRIGQTALPGLDLRAGTRLRFSFLVNDADGAGRTGWREWTPGIGTTKEPELFGELVLLADTIATDAGVSLDATASPDATTGPDASTSADVGVSLDATTPELDAGSSGADAGAQTDSGPSITPPKDEGCSCDTSGPADPAATLTVLGLVAFLLATLRHTKRDR